MDAHDGRDADDVISRPNKRAPTRRFQAFQYLVAMPNRFVAAAAVGSTVSAGGDVAHATLTSQHSGSLLILSGSGY